MTRIHRSVPAPRFPSPRLVSFALALLGAGLGACSSSSSGSSPRPAPGGPAALDGSNAVVVEWSAAAYDAFVAEEKYQNPLRAVRVLALLHVAQHDALTAIRPSYASHVTLDPAPDADPVAAAASAAYEVLAAELPGQRPSLSARLGRTLEAVADAQARDRGVALGRRAAAAVLRYRSGDGADAPAIVPRKGDGLDPGAYRPIPPDDFVFQPGWRNLKPFALQTPRQFRVAPPPALESAVYATAFEEVKSKGAKGSTARTPDETAYAKFWYEFSDIGWNRIARVVATERKLGLQATARLFALLNMAMSDAYVAGWDSKYEYEFWRPTTAIRAADADRNPRTSPDASWQSEEYTPPVPDYPSTHSALGNAGAEVLAHVFGDATPFAFTSTTGQPGAVRRFTSFSQAADENAASRVQAGLHFRFACEAGQALGRQVGSWTVATALRPASGS